MALSRITPILGARSRTIALAATKYARSGKTWRRRRHTLTGEAQNTLTGGMTVPVRTASRAVADIQKTKHFGAPRITPILLDNGR
jgi:hypothetical protein